MKRFTNVRFLCLASVFAFAITGFAAAEASAQELTQAIFCDDMQYVKDFVENAASKAEFSEFALRLNAEVGRQVCGTNVSQFVRDRLVGHTVAKDGTNVEIWSVLLMGFRNSQNEWVQFESSVTMYTAYTG